VDIGVVFGAEVFQFRMECFISLSGEPGISFVDLDERISLMEVDVVVISGEP